MRSDTRMSADVDHQAALWAVRIDADNLSDADRQALDAWLSRDARHRGALLRASAGLALIDAEHHGLATSAIATADATRQPSPRPWRLSHMIAGAALSAIAAGVAVFMLVTPNPGHYATAVGELRQVPLADGSLAVINTDSAIDVAYSPDRRNIRLAQGEAWFQVAKNKHRPFIVDAGPVHVRATGTAFSVRHQHGAVRVVVTEGTVLTWSDAAPTKTLAVSAGQETLLRPDASARTASTRMVADPAPLAWRQGGMALNQMRVADAVAEFNRYNTRKIVIRRRSIADQPMVGYFLVDQPYRFAEAVTRITGGTLSQNRDEIVIE